MRAHLLQVRRIICGSDRLLSGSRPETPEAARPRAPLSPSSACSPNPTRGSREHSPQPMTARADGVIGLGEGFQEETGRSHEVHPYSVMSRDSEPLCSGLDETRAGPVSRRTSPKLSHETSSGSRTHVTVIVVRGSGDPIWTHLVRLRPVQDLDLSALLHQVLESKRPIRTRTFL